MTLSMHCPRWHVWVGYAGLTVWVATKGMALWHMWELRAKMSFAVRFEHAFQVFHWFAGS